MKQFSFKQRIIAAIIGAYTGNLIVSGLGVLLGLDWNGGAWWDWIWASFVVGTTVSFPLALLLLYTLVPYIFKLSGFTGSPSIKNYVLVGSLSGGVPVLLGFCVTWIYAASCCGLDEIANTLPTFCLLLSHAVGVGTASLLMLYKLSSNNSFNPDSAKNAPSG